MAARGQARAPTSRLLEGSSRGGTWVCEARWPLAGVTGERGACTCHEGEGGAEARVYTCGLRSCSGLACRGKPGSRAWRTRTGTGLSRVSAEVGVSAVWRLRAAGATSERGKYNSRDRNKKRPKKKTETPIPKRGMHRDGRRTGSPPVHEQDFAFWKDDQGHRDRRSQAHTVAIAGQAQGCGLRGLSSLLHLPGTCSWQDGQRQARSAVLGRRWTPNSTGVSSQSSDLPPAFSLAVSHYHR